MTGGEVVKSFTWYTHVLFPEMKRIVVATTFRATLNERILGVTGLAFMALVIFVTECYAPAYFVAGPTYILVPLLLIGGLWVTMQLCYKALLSIGIRFLPLTPLLLVFGVVAVILRAVLNMQIPRGATMEVVLWEFIRLMFMTILCTIDYLAIGIACREMNVRQLIIDVLGGPEKAEEWE